MSVIDRNKLTSLYLVKCKSISEIAKLYSYSPNKIKYWLVKYDIPRRSISDALFKKNYPKGDPFEFKTPKTLEEGILYGLGIGLYWGEGTKMNRYSVRLGNTDPNLIRTFVHFLRECFGIKKSTLKFGLQIFTDCDIEEALMFWRKKLGISRSQFMKPTITISGKIGTYSKKNQYGVLTLYYNNKHLRDILVNMIPLK